MICGVLPTSGALHFATGLTSVRSSIRGGSALALAEGLSVGGLVALVIAAATVAGWGGGSFAQRAFRISSGHIDAICGYRGMANQRSSVGLAVGVNSLLAIRG